MAKRASKAVAKTHRRPKHTVAAPLTENDVAFAVRVTDASVNKSIPKGAHAMCAPLEDRVYSGQEFPIGAMLYIERERHGQKEHTLRRVSYIDGEKMRLATHSHQVRYREEIVYPPNPAKEKIRLLGRVKGIFVDI